MGINPYIQTLKDKMGKSFVPMMPAAGVLIENAAGEILLQERTDNGLWCPPGGSVDAGDTWIGTAIKEIQEETGLILKAEDLMPFAVISHPEIERIEYPDGSQTHYYSLWFHATHYSGTMITSNDETKSLKFYAPNSLPIPEKLTPVSQFLLYTAYPDYKKNNKFTVK